MVILYEKALFGESSSSAFVKQAFELDWKILLNEGYEAGTQDFNGLIVKAKPVDSGMVFMIFNDAHAILLL